MSQALLDEVRARRPLPTPRVARAIREAAGVSQTRLALALGVHRMTVARWEDGSFRPRGETAQAYAELLDALREIVR